MYRFLMFGLAVLFSLGLCLHSDGQLTRGAYKYSPKPYYRPVASKKASNSSAIPGGASGVKTIQSGTEEGLFEKVQDFPRSSDIYELGRKVAHLYIRGLIINGRKVNTYGTGFLVGRDLLLTNHHCVYRIPNERVGIRYKAQTFVQMPLSKFEVYMEYYGRGQKGQVSARVKSIVKANAALDYALLRLDVPLGDRYGWLELSESTPKEWSDQVRIIQHPRGREKEVVRKNSTVVAVHPDALHYKADTERGSSGAPVFAMRGDEVIAIHHMGGQRISNTKMQPNEGILMKAIVPEIEQWLPGRSTITTQKPKPVVKPTERMVLIPAGEFQMGTNRLRTVYVDAFYMDKYEVTNAQFKKFVDANPKWRKHRIADRFHDGDYLAHWRGNTYPSGKADHPVVYVSWYAAMAYAKWVGKRLPTEAEWEKAARGGLAGQKYPWGNTIDANKANYNQNIGDTTRVGRYAPNRYGLYDMAGNVWEWCIDNYTNIKPSSVLCGGSWADSATGARVAGRFICTPSNTLLNFGFRCARALR